MSKRTGSSSNEQPSKKAKLNDAKAPLETGLLEDKNNFTPEMHLCYFSLYFAKIKELLHRNIDISISQNDLNSCREHLEKCIQSAENPEHVYKKFIEVLIYDSNLEGGNGYYCFGNKEAWNANWELAKTHFFIPIIDAFLKAFKSNITIDDLKCGEDLAWWFAELWKKNSNPFVKFKLSWQSENEAKQADPASISFSNSLSPITNPASPSQATNPNIVFSTTPACSSSSSSSQASQPPSARL